MLDFHHSVAAFAPALSIGLYEPAGRRGTDSDSPQRTPRSRLREPRNTSIVNEVLGLFDDLERELARHEEATKKIEREIEQRIRELHVEAIHDGDIFSDASLNQFLRFISEQRPNTRPAVFLNDNGNLRALWKGPHHEQIGLQFMGDSRIQFVIFTWSEATQKLKQVVGTATSFDETMEHIRASKAQSLFIT